MKNPKTKKKKKIQRPQKFKSAHPGETVVLLKEHYPDAHCELDHSNPFQLLVATILSAQCTDQRVNQVTPMLFEEFPDAKAMSEASLDDLERLIGSINFFRNKAKSLKSMSQSLVRNHKGEVPQEFESLTELAGVGKKTANVVLGNAFNIASGVVVDTHVGRLSRRLGWTKLEDPEKVEDELKNIFPKDEWILLSHLLIFHGRRVCKARNPLCKTCFLVDHCPRIGVQ